MAVRPLGQSMRERFEGVVLVALVVLVLLAWCAALVYLAVRFL